MRLHLLTCFALALTVGACDKDDGPIEIVYDDIDDDGFDESVDCDDMDAATYPGADEVCDGVDQDCDGDLDEEAVDASTWYLDADGDTYGDPYEAMLACTQPEDHVADATDCNDRDAAFHPGATEDDCTDPNDYNCDGSVAFEDADHDGWPACEDCDDEDPQINPAGIEVCDGEDNDCDEATDGSDALDAVPFYLDDDEDGFGDPEVVVYDCVAPSGYVADASDCDDASDTAYPGADEVCNGGDDDCDGEDDEDPAAGLPYYLDLDGDGYGNDSLVVRACSLPDGYVLGGGDCDDLDPDSYPGNPEVCDGADNDCNDEVDDDVSGAPTFYADADGDTFGDPDSTTTACTLPDGYVRTATDCDDEEPTAHPGGVEICDDLDNDCDEEVDEEDAIGAPTWYRDADSDGFGDPEDSTQACEQPTGYVADDSDCVDGAGGGSIYPGADETCASDGDEDCDGEVDEDDAVDATTWYADADDDGYGGTRFTTRACVAPTGYVDNSADCDDLSDDVYPGHPEVCDGVDNDCNDEVDDEDGEVVGAPTWFEDWDRDGYGVPTSAIEACEAPDGYVANYLDCDDDEEVAHPGGIEICDELDNDCDDEVDEDAIDAPTWYHDGDYDTFGDPDDAVTDCETPSGYVANARDCDDGDSNIKPTAAEHCNDVDDDCDGFVDEDAVEAETWQADFDDDGWGSETFTVVSCDTPSGYVAVGTQPDCDDLDPLVYPGALEICDEVDNDCDSYTDDEDPGLELDLTPIWFIDDDEDGYGDPAEGLDTDGCEQPDGRVGNGEDCDDSSGDAGPGGTEVCDGLDNDCDGTVDNTDQTFGEGEECAAGSCEHLHWIRPGLDDGWYWISPHGVTPELMWCDMTTDGGGWTRVAYWNRVDDGETVDDFTSEMTYVWSSMTELIDRTGCPDGDCIRWADVGGSYDAMAWKKDVDVHNSGEALLHLHYYGQSMETSGSWFFVSRSGTYSDMYCQDCTSGSSGYSSTEWGYRPYGGCSETATTVTFDGTVQKSFASEITEFRFHSLMHDTRGDYGYLYAFDFLVR